MQVALKIHRREINWDLICQVPLSVDLRKNYDQTKEKWKEIFRLRQISLEIPTKKQIHESKSARPIDTL